VGTHRQRTGAGGGELRLYRRGREYSIQVDGNELMNSRVHGSEEALADLACARITDRACPRILIGGMGMGTPPQLRCTGSAQTAGVVAELVRQWWSGTGGRSRTWPDFL